MLFWLILYYLVLSKFYLIMLLLTFKTLLSSGFIWNFIIDYRIKYYYKGSQNSGCAAVDLDSMSYLAFTKSEFTKIGIKVEYLPSRTLFSEIYINPKETVMEIFQFFDVFRLILPEFFLLFFIISYLLFMLYRTKYYPSKVPAPSAQLSVFLRFLILMFFVLLLSTYNFFYTVDIINYTLQVTFHIGKHFSLFNHIFVVSYFSLFIKIIILLSTFIVVWASVAFLEKSKFYTFEYPILISLSLLGLFLLISSTDLFFMWLSLEFISLNLYLLAAINRYSIYSVEAGIKYLILGAVASGILLFGISLVYGVTVESTYWYLIYWINASEPFVNRTLLFGFLFIVLGFFFKLSVAPFHVWTPDVYEGSALSVTFFFAVPVKIGIFSFFISFFFSVLPVFFSFLEPILIIASALSMIIGSIGGLRQTKLKRLFAFSAINNIGFMFMGLACVSSRKITLLYQETTDFYYNYSEIISAIFIYLFLYSIALFGVFSFLLLSKDAKSGSFVTYITDLSSVGRAHPALSILFSFCLLSLAGIPPFGGFLGKFSILRIVFFVFSGKLWWLGLLSVFTSSISAFYYLRLIKIMFFDESPVKFKIGNFSFRPFFLLFFSSFFLSFFFIFFVSYFIFFCNFLGYFADMFIITFIVDFSLIDSKPLPPILPWYFRGVFYDVFKTIHSWKLK